MFPLWDGPLLRERFPRANSDWDVGILEALGIFPAVSDNLPGDQFAPGRLLGLGYEDPDPSVGRRIRNDTAHAGV